MVPVTIDTWPGFRGDGSGITPAENLPVRWTPEDGVAWRVAVTGYEQSPPVVDAEGVYVLFAGGQIAGLTHEGQVRWQRCLVGEYGEFKNGRGLSSSLAQTERAVIALVDHEGFSVPAGPSKRWTVIRDERCGDCAASQATTSLPQDSRRTKCS